MVEIFSWTVAGLIGLGALVGFTGVVATSVLTLVRRVRHRPDPVVVAAPVERPVERTVERPFTFTSVG